MGDAIAFVNMLLKAAFKSISCVRASLGLLLLLFYKISRLGCLVKVLTPVFKNQLLLLIWCFWKHVKECFQMQSFLLISLITIYTTFFIFFSFLIQWIISSFSRYFHSWDKFISLSLINKSDLNIWISTRQDAYKKLILFW